MTARTGLVLFAAAAGPRLGFGHLVRCGILADALRPQRRALVLRGSAATARVARQRGWRVEPARGVLARTRPALLVVDDPTPERIARWVRLARRQRIPVAAIHDGGAALGRDAAADVVIDGSVTSGDARFAILHPGIARHRAAGARGRLPGRVVVALGGGVHVRRIGAAVAAAVIAAVPGTRVDLAAGFAPARQMPRLPIGCRWVQAPAGLGALLASASAAVVAGGLTLYEACALGVPTVAMPVVPAQRPAILTMASARAVLTVRGSGRGRPVPPSDVAAAVAMLLANRTLAADLGRQARRVVDGRGAARVAARLRRLLIAADTRALRHA